MSTPPWGEEPDQGRHQPPPQQPPYQPYGQQPHGQQPYGQPGYGYTAPAPLNGLAVASLAVSVGGLFLCCGAPSIVGAVLGHVARRQVRERGENGAGLALAGVVTGWVAFGLFLLLAVLYALIFAGAFGAAIQDDGY